MWWRRAAILDLIDYMFISDILMGVWYHFVVLHLCNFSSKCWWTPLFEDHALTLFLPPLLPLNFLFNPNCLILSRVLTSNLCLWNCYLRLMMCWQESVHGRWALEPFLLVACLLWKTYFEIPFSQKSSPLRPIKMR